MQAQTQETVDVVRTLEVLFQLKEKFKAKEQEYVELAVTNPAKYTPKVTFTKGVAFGIEMALREFAVVNSLDIKI